MQHKNNHISYSSINAKDMDAISPVLLNLCKEVKGLCAVVGIANLFLNKNEEVKESTLESRYQNVINSLQKYLEEKPTSENYIASGLQNDLAVLLKELVDAAKRSAEKPTSLTKFFLGARIPKKSFEDMRDGLKPMVVLLEDMTNQKEEKLGSGAKRIY